ncbi:MAG: S41 family peptidase [Bacteroidota bacterium]
MKRSPLLIVVMLFCICCSKRNDNTENLHLDYTFLKEAGSINPKLKGVWQSIGEGYIWDATGDSLRLYSYTQNFCSLERNPYLESLMNASSRFVSNGPDTISVYYLDLGEKTTLIQNKRELVRIDKLPANCKSLMEMQEAKAKPLLSFFFETLEENYAFSQERNMNWTELKEKYIASVSETTSEEELFKLMGEVVSQTKDQHTKIISKEGQKIQYTITPSAQFTINAFNAQSEIQDLGKYFNLFFERNYQNISDSLLRGKGQKDANGQLEWGSLSLRIGYLNIHSFAGFASNQLDRKTQIDTLEKVMSRIVSALADKDALIVDLSFNFGGFDAACFTIASFFTDKITPVYTTQTYFRGEIYQGESLSVIPASERTFTKPVYVLMTDISRSAAEIFAIQMKAFPNVQLVGMNTLGTQSGMLNKAIGNFQLTLSNQRYLTPDNQVYEAVGVPPDIEMEIFSDEMDVFNAHKLAVKRIMKMIE